MESSDGIHLTRAAMEALFDYIRTHSCITEDDRPTVTKVAKHTGEKDVVMYTTPVVTSTETYESESEDTSDSEDNYEYIEVTPTPEPTAEPTPTPEPTAEPTPTPEPTPEITATPEPTATLEPEVTSTPDETNGGTTDGDGTGEV